MTLSLQYTEKYLFDSSELCSECHNPLVFDSDTSEMICSTCGLVAARAIRITLPHELERSPPYTLAQYGSRTRILVQKDHYPTHVNRLVKSHSMVFKNSTTRNLHIAIREIQRLGSQLQIPRIVLETAFLLYRKVYAQKIGMRGIKPKAAAVLYLACRVHGLLIFLKEIIHLTEYSLKTLERRVWIIQRDLELNLPPICPKKVIYRLKAALDVSFQTMIHALKCLHYLKQNNVFCGSPVPIAAAVFYLSCTKYNEHRPLWLIAGAVHLCEVTVRIAVKKLRPELRFFSLRRRADL